MAKLEGGRRRGSGSRARGRPGRSRGRFFFSRPVSGDNVRPDGEVRPGKDTAQTKELYGDKVGMEEGGGSEGGMYTRRDGRDTHLMERATNKSSR